MYLVSALFHSKLPSPDAVWLLQLPCLCPPHPRTPAAGGKRKGDTVVSRARLEIAHATPVYSPLVRTYHMTPIVSETGKCGFSAGQPPGT